MALLVPNAAETIMLANFLNKTAPQDLTLKLYTNNVTPAEADTEASYTEAAGNGYAAVDLVAANWVLTGGAPSSAAYPQVTYTFTGALGNVYGYFVVQKVSGKLMWAEKFTNGPYNIQNNGDQIKVTPNITLE
jgi:hypothetical protein